MEWTGRESSGNGASRYGLSNGATPRSRGSGVSSEVSERCERSMATGTPGNGQRCQRRKPRLPRRRHRAVLTRTATAQPDGKEETALVTGCGRSGGEFFEGTVHRGNRGGAPHHESGGANSVKRGEPQVRSGMQQARECRAEKAAEGV